MTDLKVTTISSGTIEPHILGVLPDEGKVQILIDFQAIVLDGEDEEAVTITVFGSPTSLETPSLATDIFDYVSRCLKNPEFVTAWEKANK